MLALIPVEPFRHRYPLAALYPHGFTSPDAAICKNSLKRGNYVYIGSRVILFRKDNGGNIILGDKVHLNDGNCIETGAGGSVEIGEGTYVQPECQFSAYAGSIKVGKRVQIAPRCAFYPYDHAMSRAKSMMDQPLVSKGGIVVKDEAWLGYGVVVLDNVTIGVGAVVGAGSVVKDDIPDYAIAAGIPAKVIKMRE
jgi:acetyltransferase-like isoleucine patch superfamily enzyme